MDDIEARVKALEDEFKQTAEELRQILLDIRAFLMEVQTPLPATMDKEELPGQSDSKKGEEPHGNRQEN